MARPIERCGPSMRWKHSVGWALVRFSGGEDWRGGEDVLYLGSRVVGLDFLVGL